MLFLFFCFTTLSNHCTGHPDRVVSFSGIIFALARRRVACVQLHKHREARTVLLMSTAGPRNTLALSVGPCVCPWLAHMLLANQVEALGL